jgi:hypothetical protein
MGRHGVIRKRKVDGPEKPDDGAECDADHDSDHDTNMSRAAEKTAPTLAAFSMPNATAMQTAARFLWTPDEAAQQKLRLDVDAPNWHADIAFITAAPFQDPSKRRRAPVSEHTRHNAGENGDEIIPDVLDGAVVGEIEGGVVDMCWSDDDEQRFRDAVWGEVTDAVVGDAVATSHNVSMLRQSNSDSTESRVSATNPHYACIACGTGLRGAPACRSIDTVSKNMSFAVRGYAPARMDIALGTSCGVQVDNLGAPHHQFPSTYQCRVCKWSQTEGPLVLRRGGRIVEVPNTPVCPQCKDGTRMDPVTAATANFSHYNAMLIAGGLRCSVGGPEK